ncbi:MAG: hypothetical protein U1E78_04140 [Gammaproteobacteria bacterium]
MWLLISAIPVIVLLMFDRHLPRTARLILRICCIPFLILIAIYSLILGAALILAFIAFVKYQQFKVKKDIDAHMITARIIEHDERQE